MLIALDNKNNRLISFDTNKDQKPFFCPGCKSEVNIRKGLVKIHHFYHINKNNCPHSGESKEHMEHKYELYKRFKRFYPNTDMEVKMDDLIADVFVPELNISFEIQRSPLTKETFIFRTDKYIKKSIRVFWIFLECDLNTKLYKSIKIKEMHLSAMKLYKDHLYIYDKEDSHIIKISVQKDSKVEYNDYLGDYQTYYYKKQIYIKNKIFLFKNILKDFSKGF